MSYEQSLNNAYPATADMISVKEGGGVDLRVKCAILKKDDIFIGFIPSLRLSAKSDSEEGLRTRLDAVVNSFFKYYNNISKLDKELKKLGWNRGVPVAKLTDKEGVFISPDSISVPNEILNATTKFEQEERHLQLEEC